MKIPSKQECMDNFEKYKVPNNIRKHCILVSKVSVFLGKELEKKGIDLDLEVLEMLGLVHDMFKVVVLKELVPSEYHHPEAYTQEEIAMWKHLRETYPNMYESGVYAAIFKEKYPKFCDHVRRLSDPTNDEKEWHEQIVHYADWRVSNMEILSLAGKLKGLKERYTKTDGRWEEYERVIFADEAKVFEHLYFKPEELKEKFEQSEKSD